MVQCNRQKTEGVPWVEVRQGISLMVNTGQVLHRGEEQCGKGVNVHGADEYWADWRGSQVSYVGLMRGRGLAGRGR